MQLSYHHMRCYNTYCDFSGTVVDGYFDTRNVQSTDSVNFLGLEVFLATPTAWAARNQPRTPENRGTQYYI